LVLCFLTLVFKDKYGYLIGIPSILIITREILVSGIREFFGTKNNIFDVLTLSKYKTACQMLAIILLLTSTQNFIWNVKFYYIGIVFLWISAFIALYTGLVYFIKSLKILED
jgi:phosphatidylglycerophosphate synthase